MNFKMNRHKFFVLSVWKQTKNNPLAKDSSDRNLSSPHKDVSMQDNIPPELRAQCFSQKKKNAACPKGNSGQPI